MKMSLYGIQLDRFCLRRRAILSGRSSLIYKELFVILTHHAGRLNLQFRPAKITSDFELALIKTVAEEVNISDNSFSINAKVSFSFRMFITWDVIST